MRGLVGLGALVVVCASAFGSLAQANDFLTRAQLQDFFSGRVVDTRTMDNIEVTFHYNADGTFRAFFNRPKNPHWSPGTWWVTDDDTMCFKNDKNDTFCNKYRRDGEKYTRHALDGTAIRGRWEPRPK